MAVHSTPHRVHFDAFDVDLRAGELHRDGSKLHLQDKPFQILALLLERPGEVVTREELREHVWPADTFVDFEHGLNTAVKKLRQAPFRDPETARLIRERVKAALGLS